jgi:hypothetical protein
MGRPHILVIDDEPELREAIARSTATTLRRPWTAARERRWSAGIPMT